MIRKVAGGSLVLFLVLWFTTMAPSDVETVMVYGQIYHHRRSPPPDGSSNRGNAQGQEMLQNSERKEVELLLSSSEETLQKSPELTIKDSKESGLLYSESEETLQKSPELEDSKASELLLSGETLQKSPERKDSKEPGLLSPEESLRKSLVQEKNAMETLEGCPLESIWDGRYDENCFWTWNGKCKGKWQWFQAEDRDQVCNLLDDFEMYFIGSSTDRRLYFTLIEMVLGHKFAFLNGVQDSRAGKHLPDSKIVPNLVKKKPQAAACLHVDMHLEKWGNGMIRTANRILTRLYNRTKDTAEKQRKVVIMLQFGLYTLASNTLSASRHDQTLRAFFESDLFQRSMRDGVIWIWHPPSPVNSAHHRFKGFFNNVDVNEKLNEWWDVSVATARRYNVTVFDTFHPLMEPAREGKLLFETGSEWSEKQIGGIHLLDNGRRLVAQLFLNMLRLL